MMLDILILINYGLILIFGILLSLSFAGIELTGRNQWTTLCAITILIFIQVTIWYFLGYETTWKLYPLITHLPLVLFISLYYKRSPAIAIVSVLSAYLCCQTPHWIASVALNIFNSHIAYYIVNSLTVFPVFYLLKKYVVTSVHRLMNISRRSLLLFGIVPFMYYLFDYGTTVYSDSLYRGMEMAVVFMPSVVSIFYYIFIIFYYNEMQHRSNAENERMLLSVQIKQAQTELDAFRESQEKTAVYRHDMRHHLNLIAGFLADNDTDKAKDYIRHTESDIDAITPIRYCDNNTVNLIISYFASKAKVDKIAFTADVQIPKEISVKETELCALLSNGLENAVKACAQVADERLRTVHINCKLHKDKLLIFIENSFTGGLLTDNGKPISNQEGHGFGIRSMIMITEKYNGYYSYTSKNGIFTFRIALPL